MTSATTPKTILLKGDPIAKEAVMVDSEALRPGMLIELTSAGTLQRQSSADVYCQAAFVRENELIGEGIDDLYADDETIPYYIGRNGDEFYALLADNETIARGAILQSNGSGGTLKAIGSGIGKFVALEAVTTSGAVGRIKVGVV